jgi:hypothetical protein
MDLEDFTEKASQLKVLVEQARDEEANAYSVLKGLQVDMLQCITQEDIPKLDLLEQRYTEVEDRWRTCSLYTAELRAEMQDLIRERNGENVSRAAVPTCRGGEEAGALVPHGAAARTAHLSTRGTALSLSKSKPAPTTAADIAPTRRPMIVAAFPDVNPRLAGSAQLPIGESQVQLEFDALLRSLPEPPTDGTAPLKDVVNYFDRQERLGVPLNCRKWVAESLAKFNHDLRRTVAASRTPSTRGFALEDCRPVTFDEFAYLLVRWAQN